MPWWGWLLLALVALALVALLWALLAGDDDDEAAFAPQATQQPARDVDRRDLTEVTESVQRGYSPPSTTVPATETPSVGEASTPAQGTETPAGAGGPITDLTTIFEEQNKISLVGRRVNLQGQTAAEVQSVVGDKTFWVGPSENQQVFVALSEEQDAAGAEGKVDVNEGQTVRITGEIMELPSIERIRKEWGRSEVLATKLVNQQIYISAEQVEVIER